MTSWVRRRATTTSASSSSTTTRNPVVLLLLLAACASEPTFDDRLAALGDCPEGDAAWREAIERAGAEERLEALHLRAAELEAVCSGRWEPAWTAGDARFRQFDLEVSANHFREAMTRAETAGDPVGIANAANRLGWVAFAAGDLDEGERLLRQAIAAARSVERTDLEAFARNNLAAILLERGLFAEAGNELAIAEAQLREIGHREAALGAAFNRAIVRLELGDATAARKLLEQLHVDAQGIDAWTVDAAAVALGNLHIALGEYRQARRWHEKIGGEQADLAALASFGLGRLALFEGRLDDAVTALERTVATADEVAVSLLAEAFLGEAERRAGRPDDSRQRLLDVLRRADESDTEETAWVARWLIGRGAIAEGLLDEAVAYLDASVALLEEQSADLDPTGEGFHFLRERFDPYVDLMRATIGGEVSREREVVGRVLATMLRVQARALRRDAPAPGLDSLQEALADEERLIGYVIGENHGVALAIGPQRAEARTIPGRATLLPALTSYRAALENGHTDEEAGSRLRRALIDPFAAGLEGARRLYLVPDRELNLVPFAALPIEGGVLVERFETAILPAVGIPSAATVDGPLLAAGQPTFGPDDGFDELPWSGWEIERVARAHPTATTLTGGDFSRERFLELDLAAFGTLHLATHAQASTQDPSLSGIVFSGGERLALDAITRLRLRHSLVVLSACRTGEGELVPGQGVVSLGQAFLRAGARGVVVSRWRADDAKAARLMEVLHQRLAAGDPPVTALAAARREMLERERDPAAWAPFVVVVRPL